MNYLPGNLYILRKSRKLQQEEMQTALGISRATWSNYENGKTEPQIQTLIQVASYFEVTMDDLLRKDLSQDADWIERTPNRYQQVIFKKNLYAKEQLPVVSERDVNTPDTLQEILKELKGMRRDMQAFFDSKM